ncbi:hypothetical protein E3N88_32934 [Mikania micrantha]|uniref:Protein kinase domain-containing protein n=1 Tax=Mikania micrantha TaxID=192012 RepID=A0A5N6M9X4_9ASTR|nr:hypothetical protein E3N88_32934 [Mikania micrantha]
MQPAASRRLYLVLDNACGTMGYIDPVYLKSASVSHKSDVYSLGVVLFEVLTGRKAYSFIDTKWVLLAEVAKSHYENETLVDIIHPGLMNQMDSKALKIFSEAAYCCLNDQRAQRPNIDRVIFALDRALELQLACENSEYSRLGLKATSTGPWKGKDLEHLRIGFDAIKKATENFNKKYWIGSGGYGEVYKAELEHFDSSVMKDEKESQLPKKRSAVAIKCITNKEDTQGEQGFIAEIETLSTCMHPNIVSLLGFCHEPPHMILVYELLSNGSLDDYLGTQGKMANLTWVQRIKICIDIARGLNYIHTIMENKQKIIHRDIKSANILLDDTWKAKIADFGLSKLHPLDHMASTMVTNQIAGTPFYLDPEYERTGKLKKESDVYSFGVVLFEIMSGRLAYDPVFTYENEKGLAPIVRQHYEKGTIKEMVDNVLNEESTFTLSKGPNQDSLKTFSVIGYKCLAEKQVHRPSIQFVIEELEKALKFQETQIDSLQISFEEIRLATQNFKSIIGKGGFGNVYKGEILHVNGRSTPIAVKRLQAEHGQGEKEFLTELQILFEYKHKNIIGLLGYCNENKEKILVYEYASKGSLDMLLKDASLTWTQRLKIGIDVATGLNFLHGGVYFVIHRDMKSSNILLTNDWNTKITDFGLSVITTVNHDIDFVVDTPCGTFGYIDPECIRRGFVTREDDIYSFGVVLFEMMCGSFVFEYGGKFVTLVKHHYKEGKLDELVLKSIKDKIMPKSLATYQRIAYECLHNDRAKRPTISELISQLKKALEFQEAVEIWEPKLPKDYKEIVGMSKTPVIYYNMTNKDLYEMFSKGVLLQKGKVCLSVSNNGNRNERVSATMFSFGKNVSHNKRISVQTSRFQRVVKIMDISNLNIHIKIKTQFLSPNVIYGAHLVFKFCEPRKISSSKLMYVNLKYQMGSETLHAYFATCEDDEWMMVELCRFIPHKKDVEFKVLLQSLSRYYCGSGAIYVEGIHFRAINNATLKVKPEVVDKLNGAQRVLESNSDSVQQTSLDYDEITQLEDDEKLFSLGKANGKKCHMLPARMFLYDSSNVKCFNWRPCAESRFLEEVVEILSNQLFRIKFKIEAQKLTADTNYACYLVFKLSQQCHGLHCPVKVQDVLLRKDKQFKFLYFRSPRLVNLHGNKRVPKLRKDGLTEVIVWEFNLGNKFNDDHHPMSLKLRCYEGTMSGLIVYGIEFRPI